jgi:excisionase family DNA binding protein
MRGWAAIAGMLDVRSRRVFFRCEIMRQDQPLETKLESSSDFPDSEVRAARGPYSGIRFGRIFSLAFFSSASVAAFRGPNSDSRNRVCFATARDAREIIAPEASHSQPGFLNIRRDSSSEGDGCMKDTDHPIRHPLRHPWIFVRGRSRRRCASRDDQFGRGQNTGLGWSDPTFVQVSVPKAIRGVAPAQLRGDCAEVFCPRRIPQQEATVMNTGDENHTELLTVHEIARLLKVPVSWVYGHTRKRSIDRLPGYRLGKYWRFRADEVMAWVQRQRRDREAA